MSTVCEKSEKMLGPLGGGLTHTVDSRRLSGKCPVVVEGTTCVAEGKRSIVSRTQSDVDVTDKMRGSLVVSAAT